MPYISLHFIFYEGGKLVWMQGREPCIWDSLAVGTVSGTAAKLFTFPVDNVKETGDPCSSLFVVVSYL